MDSALFEISYTLVTIFLLGFFIYRSLYITTKHARNWFLFGFIFNTYSLSWLYTVYPLDWLSPGLFQLVGISIMLFILALCGGVSFLVVQYSFTKKLNSWKRVFVFSCLLAWAEVIRSLLFSLIFSGNGGTVGLHWTAGTIGNALSTTPFIEYAYFGGTYALTAVLGLIIFVFLVRKQLTTWYLIYILLLCGVLATHYGVPTNTPTETLHVAVVTTDFAKTISREKLAEEFVFRTKKLDTMTSTLVDKNPAIVAYPEDARYISHLSDKRIEELKQQFPHTLFVDGDTRVVGGKFSNFSIFFTPQEGSVVHGRGKVFLFPFSEYLPVAFETIFKPFVGGGLDQYKATHTYTPESAIGIIEHNGVRIGTLICSEILSFQTIHALSRENPSLVFFQSYLGIFNGRIWFSMHDRSFTKIAAAQLRTPVLSSANGAESYIVSPYGTIIATIPRGFNTTELEINKKMIRIINK